MKKKFFVVISLAISAALIGCGSNTSAISNPATSGNKSEVVDSSLSDSNQPIENEDDAKQAVEAEPEITALPESTEEVVKTEPESNATNEDQSSSYGIDYDKVSNIDYHNYIDGDVFDLDAYASALGYKYVTDTSYNEEFGQELTTYAYIADNCGYRIFIHFGGGAIGAFTIAIQNAEFRIQDIEGGHSPATTYYYPIIGGERVDNGNHSIKEEVLEIDASIMKYLVSKEIGDFYEFIKDIPSKKPAYLAVTPGIIEFKDNGFEDREKTVLNEDEREYYIIDETGVHLETNEDDEDDDDFDEDEDFDEE